MARFRFRPPLWAWLVVPAVCTMMLGLAQWQHQRAALKRALQQELLDAQTQPPVALDGASAAAPGRYRRARVQGEYLAQRQLLLDNQSHARRPGYHVWTPLRLADGALVIVNRGWVVQPADRRELPALPAPTGAVTVDGLWRDLPLPGIRLEADNCAPADWPRIVQYPTAADLACLYDAPVAAGVLLLDAQAPGGYERSWSITPQMPPERHEAYAFQWLALALAVIVLFITLNLKRIDD